MSMTLPPARIGKFAPGVTNKPAGRVRKPKRKMLKSAKPMPVLQGLINR